MARVDVSLTERGTVLCLARATAAAGPRCVLIDFATAEITAARGLMVIG